MSDGAGIGGVIKDEISETYKEVKQQVAGGAGGANTKPTTPQQDPQLAQFAQQDKAKSAQREAAIKQELAMMAHQSASGLGMSREAPQSQLEEAPQKPGLSAPVLPGSRNNFGTPLDTKLATTKRESRDSKAVG